MTTQHSVHPATACVASQATAPRDIFCTRHCMTSHKGVTRLSPYYYSPSLTCPISRFVSNRAYMGSFGTATLPRLQDLIMMANEGDIKITLSVLERGLHYRNLLKDVSKKGETNVVLDVPASHIAEILSMVSTVPDYYQLADTLYPLLDSVVGGCFVDEVVSRLWILCCSARVNALFYPTIILTRL
ncbi:glutamate receptor ionotropic, kainate 1 [Trichonephila clavipes]|nr:glutamate receptor ionotropic, kainate 1 [Trichonephila clavipes]